MDIGFPGAARTAALLFPAVLLAAASSSPARDRDIRHAERYLKYHLRALERQYDFEDWDRELKRALRESGRLASSLGRQDSPDPGGYRRLKDFENSLEKLRQASLSFNAYLNQLNVVVVGNHVDAAFKEDGRAFPLEKRQRFQRDIKPQLMERMKQVRYFQLRLNALEENFDGIKSEWLFAFSLDFLGRRVQDLLARHRFDRSEALYDDLALQLDYWERAMADDAEQAHSRLLALKGSHAAESGKVLDDLNKLLEVLHTDMLFSDLLAHAHEKRVEFTLAVEERIENTLKAQSSAHLQPIRERIDAWRRLESRLESQIALADGARRNQRQLRLEQAQRRRMEEERQAALRAEQERLERERRQRLDQALASLTSFDFKSGGDLALDQESRKALSAKTGLLKSSYVGSAQKKLHVPKQSFSDSLTQVQKFQVEESAWDISNLSLDQKTAQSLFVYASPEGRTTKKDLDRFVEEVAMGSFDTEFNYFSYSAPNGWEPGRRMGWVNDKNTIKKVQDREFSYVELVVDAHRKRPKNSRDSQGVESVNLPPNMLLVLHPRGKVLRYQTFTDIKDVVISPGDLVDGKLHYKFLNYSSDRRNIYLNAIDLEMKTSRPGDKS